MSLSLLIQGMEINFPEGEAAHGVGAVSPIQSFQDLVPGTNTEGEFWSRDPEPFHPSEACYLPPLLWIGMLLASLHQPQMC